MPSGKTSPGSPPTSASCSTSVTAGPGTGNKHASSYDTAEAVTGRRCGRVAGKRQLEQLVQAAAVGIDGFYARRVPVPCTSEVLLVLSADGKGIVMRPEGLRPATRKAAAGKKQGRASSAPGLPRGRSRAASGWPPWRVSTARSRHRADRTT
jgi:hypothetical protein